MLREFLNVYETVHGLHIDGFVPLYEQKMIGSVKELCSAAAVIFSAFRSICVYERNIYYFLLQATGCSVRKVVNAVWGIVLLFVSFTFHVHIFTRFFSAHVCVCIYIIRAIHAGNSLLFSIRSFVAFAPFLFRLLRLFLPHSRFKFTFSSMRKHVVNNRGAAWFCPAPFLSSKQHPFSHFIFAVNVKIEIELVL